MADPTDLIDRRKADEIAERLDMHGIGRRQFLKVLGATVGAAAAGNILAACGGGGGGGTASAASDGKIAILNYSLVGDYSVQWIEGLAAAAKQLGMSFTSYDGKGDAGTQQNEFNQAFTKGIDSVFILAADGGLVKTLAEQANTNEMYFSAAWTTQPWFTPWDSGPYYSQFLIDNEVTAIAAACDLLFKAMGEEGTVIRLSGFGPEDATEIVRLAGFKKALAKYPKIKLGGELSGEYEPAASQKATAALLTRYPETTGVVAINDDATTGAVAAIEAAGKVPGKDIFVNGANGSNEGVKRIAAGTQVSTTGNVPAYPSYVITANFFDRLNGFKMNEAERIFGWKAVILEKSNVQPYLDRYVTGSVDKQFDAKLLSRTLSPKNWDWQFEAFPWDNIGELFPGVPKPSGYQYPAAYLKAKEDGSFKKVAEEWKEHYKIPVLGPSPLA